VPRTLKGARLITADDAQTLMSDAAAVFIDVYPRAPRPPNLPAGTVWRDPPHMSIAGAHWLPNVGYGVLSPEFETYFRSRLETLTGRDAARPVVFFCLKDCWMSWNAAKRALSWGYRSVIWFPEGTDGWQAIGNDLVPMVPVP
jgi:PQQ-dependent catabolism-associated CXXCW motif protein